MGRMNEAPLVEQAVALDSRQLLHAMLRHEAAMARALSELGLLPAAQAESIANTCKPVLFDVDQIWRETLLQQDAVATGAPPLMVTLRESVALFNPQAAAAVFRGGLSEVLQDNAVLILTHAWWTSLCAQLHALMRALDKKQQPLQGLPALVQRLHQGVTEGLQLQCPTQDPLAQAQAPALLQALANALDMPLAKHARVSLSDQCDAWTSLGTDLVLLTLCLARIAQGLPAAPRSPWGAPLQAEAARLPLRLAQWVQERALASRPRDFWQVEWPLWTTLTGGAVGALNALAAGLAEEDQAPVSL
jgi:hypothetical protein